MATANPFSPSQCGQFIVENYPGDIYANVMTITWAAGRQRRAEVDGARYEREADELAKAGRTAEAEIARGFAGVTLTIAADLRDALDNLSVDDRRAA